MKMPTRPRFRRSALALSAACTWLCSSTALADLSGVRINEIMAGYNGNSTVQFVELLVEDEASKAWGPGAGEATSRAQLEFYNARGERTGRYVFAHDAPAGGRTVLVATGYYAAMKNALTPDFRMPREITPVSGKVCFTDNPDNAAAVAARSCVSYGAYVGTQEDEGAPVNNPLPILGASSLKRTAGFDFNSLDPGNRAFALGTPTPANTTVGTTLDIISNTRSAGGHRFKSESTVKQGENLFMNERFEGNGRTCGTCHIPPFFNMTPAHVAAKKPWDPLFLSEKNRGINNLTLTAPSTPSDLRGLVKDARGRTGLIVNGTGDKYMVTNGSNLSGSMTDERGNRGAVASVTAGNLRGPNPVNGSANGLEDPTGRRLRSSNDTRFPQGRALVLENIDGFDQPEVFRKSPHLLNIKDTAPYGFSGNFPTLSEFTTGAVVQHFPLSLQRRIDMDVRLPTTEELNALVAFQESIKLEPDHNPFVAVDRAPEEYNVTTQLQKQGLFEFDALCNGCHFGSPVHAHHIGMPTDKTIALATGAANNPINANDALPSEPPSAPAGQSTRAFDTPPLMGVRHTAPYFHDGSAATLEDVVDFYVSPAFKTAVARLSPGLNGGPLLADPSFQLPAGAKESLVAFLRVLTKLPVDFPRGLSFGSVATGSHNKATFAIRNSSRTTVTINALNITPNDHQLAVRRGSLPRFETNGLQPIAPNAFDFIDFSEPGQFAVTSVLPGREIAAGQSIKVEVEYAPTTPTMPSLPFHSANLELSLVDSAGESWEIGINLIGKAR